MKFDILKKRVNELLDLFDEFMSVDVDTDQEELFKRKYDYKIRMLKRALPNFNSVMRLSISTLKDNIFNSQISVFMHEDDVIVSLKYGDEEHVITCVPVTQAEDILNNALNGYQVLQALYLFKDKEDLRRVTWNAIEVSIKSQQNKDFAIAQSNNLIHKLGERMQKAQQDIENANTTLQSASEQLINEGYHQMFLKSSTDDLSNIT